MIPRYFPTLAAMLASAFFLAASSQPASAAAVAYWRFDDGPANTDVVHTIPDGQFEGTIQDISGSGNHLSAWSQGGCCGYQYRADVPFATVPGTGSANNFSVKNTGGGPGMFTDSLVSNPTGTNLETWMPTAFTIEASWKPEAGGHRTVVGRDAQGVATADQALAALYLQAQPDNSLAIKFTDAAGVFHEAVSPAGLIQGFDFPTDPDGLLGNWYNIAAVSDGATLKLYVNNALVASSDIVSDDPRLAIGTISGGDWHAGEWSVGRGLFNGGHGDRAYGFIDEVRISDEALAPSEFLAAGGPAGPGDFDNDGDVDGADFLLGQRNAWQTLSLADWKANFGQGGGGAGAVPEPQAFVLLAGAVTALGAVGRARHK